MSPAHAGVLLGGLLLAGCARAPAPDLAAPAAVIHEPGGDVYLVSNADNPRKPFVSPLKERAALIDARLAEADCAGVRRYAVRASQQLDWRGREEVCRELRRTVQEELKREAMLAIQFQC